MICIKAFFALALLSLSQLEAQIFVANLDSGVVGSYTTGGGVINASLVSGFAGPRSIAIQGGGLFALNPTAGVIGKYDAGTGVVINASIVTGLSSAQRIAAFGSSLLVSNFSDGKIEQYGTVDGALINPGFIGGLSSPLDIATFGTMVFVSQYQESGSIAKYDFATGALNANFITGSLRYPGAIAVSGGFVFAAYSGLSGFAVAKYDAVTGVAVNESFITGSGVYEPFDMAVSDSVLYVTSFGNGTVSSYDINTGSAVSVPLISGLAHPTGLAVIPEPSAWASFTALSALLFSAASRRRRG